MPVWMLLGWGAAACWLPLGFLILARFSPLLACLEFQMGRAALSRSWPGTGKFLLYQAAGNDFASAFVDLGWMYETANGVPRDTRLSGAMFLIAAERGDPWAQEILGYKYEEGYGAEKNLIRAYMWYSIARGTFIRHGLDAHDDGLKRVRRQLGVHQLEVARKAALDMNKLIGL